MNLGTMNSTDTMIRKSNARQTRLAGFLESAEVRMLIHDLRHLVQAIVGSIDTLQIAMEEHAADLTDKSLYRLRRNTSLAVDMLGYLAADRQACDKEMAGCDVAQEVDLIIDSLDSLLKQNDIMIHQEVSPHTIVKIRKADLNRLLLNLILNAIEATHRRDSAVTITAGTVSNGSVQMSVQDHGCGIDKDKQASIFEEGYTTKSREGNQGLGLAVVKQVLEVYGGTMRLQSWPGKGTEFTVCLPGAIKGREGQ